MNHPDPVIAIIGAGFSGSLLAVHLARRLPPNARVILTEKREGFGTGLAYSTGSRNHLVNVRAENMSAFDGEPDHFVKWLVDQDLMAPWEVEAGAFVPRRVFGAYMQSMLTAQLWEADGKHDLYLYPDEAIGIDLDPDGATVAMAGGRNVRADAAVLAVGNFPPLPPKMTSEVWESPRFIANPWEEGVFDRISSSASVLVIGTGLTMVDFVISLREHGHRGPITALSRRGLLPRRHAKIGKPLDWDAAELPAQLGQLVKVVRRRIRHEAAAGLDWRQVLDGLRPHADAVWSRLTHDEKRRFLRHLRPYWDVHRHRLAPHVADHIDAEIAKHRLAIKAGQILGIITANKGLAVEWRPRGDRRAGEFKVGYVVNCAGPASDFRHIRQSLIRGLLDGGQVHADSLRLGLEVAEDLRVMDAEGHPADRLYAIGPITRGRFWEVTSVPDIRRQCERLAEDLARRFS